MGKTLKLTIILFVINFAIFAIGDAVHVDDFVLYLFLLPVSITVSVILLIIASIKNARKSYLAKDVVQRKRSRKKSLIVLGCVVAVLLAGYVVFMFACGYKLPGRDRHKNWPVFPGSSNPNMVLAPIPNLYVYSIEPIPHSPYYIIHFTRDSILYHEVNVGGVTQNFGIIDNTGKFKIEYSKSTTEYLDGNRIIVEDDEYDSEKLPKTCEIIDLKTLIITKAQINKIRLTASKDEFDDSYGTEQGQARFKEKYQTDFFRSLAGVKSIMADGYYDGVGYRGYTLYKDTDGQLYKASYEDRSQLDLLSPQVAGYTPEKDDRSAADLAPNIKQSAEPIVLYNEANGGFGSSGLFYRYHQTWLLYYSAAVVKNVTSFKIEGSDANSPYTTFSQLNKPSRSQDTLVFFADGKVYRLFNNKTANIKDK